MGTFSDPCHKTIFDKRANITRDIMAETRKSLGDWQEEVMKREMKTLKFIHVTKNGGTSIEDEAKKQNILWGRFDAKYKEGARSAKEEKFDKAFHHYPFSGLQSKLKRSTIGFSWSAIRTRE